MSANREHLRKECVRLRNEGKSRKSIAEMVGVKISSVNWWTKDIVVNSKHRRSPRWKRESFCKLRNQGMTVKYIAEALEIATSTAYSWNNKMSEKASRVDSFDERTKAAIVKLLKRYVEDGVAIEEVARRLSLTDFQVYQALEKATMADDDKATITLTEQIALQDAHEQLKTDLENANNLKASLEIQHDQLVAENKRLKIKVQDTRITEVREMLLKVKEADTTPKEVRKMPSTATRTSAKEADTTPKEVRKMPLKVKASDSVTTLRKVRRMLRQTAEIINIEQSRSEAIKSLKRIDEVCEAAEKRGTIF